MTLTGPERRLLQKCGTKLQAFSARRSTSTSDEHKHFMKVLQAFEEGNSSSDGYRQFLKVCDDAAEPISKEERVWLKYIELCWKKRDDLRNNTNKN